LKISDLRLRPELSDRRRFLELSCSDLGVPFWAGTIAKKDLDNGEESADLPLTLEGDAGSGKDSGDEWRWGDLLLLAFLESSLLEVNAFIEA
jgi:hypothetical protein